MLFSTGGFTLASIGHLGDFISSLQEFLPAPPQPRRDLDTEDLVWVDGTGSWKGVEFWEITQVSPILVFFGDFLGAAEGLDQGRSRAR